MATPKKQPNGRWVKRFRYKAVTGAWKDTMVVADTKKECEEKYIRFMASLEARTEMLNVNVRQLYEQYIQSAALHLKHSSLKSAQDVIRLHILPYFENRQVSSLTLRDIERWKKDIEAKGLKFKYKTKIYCAFTAMLNYAMKHEYITRNVVSLAGDFRNDEIKEEEPVWTLDDFKKVYAVIDNPTFRAYYTFLFFTGVRKNEATCLTWRDFDADRLSVTINKTLNRKGCESGAKWEITTPKTKRSNRRVLLPDCLRQELNQYYDWCKQHDGFTDDCFVFGITEPLVEQTIRRKLDEYAARAGVPRIKVHNLRHSHDSYLHSLGVDDFAIAAIAGRTLRITEDTYIHLYGADRDRTRLAIDTTLPQSTPQILHKTQKRQ